MRNPKCSPITPQQHATVVWALPVSLATTQGIIIIFFSSGYLDVSVPRVGSLLLECHTFSVTGCPIRKSRDISLVCSSPWLIAAYHVLHRLLESRHPPYALICFKNIQPAFDTINIENRSSYKQYTYPPPVFRITPYSHRKKSIPLDFSFTLRLILLAI